MVNHPTDYESASARWADRFDRRHVGAFFAFMATLIFVSLDLTVRYAKPHLSVWHIMFGRSLIGIVLMGFAARGLKMNLWGQRRGLLALVGLVGVAGVTCLTLALLMLPLFEALVLLYLYPVFAALFSPWLTLERTNLGDWLLIGLAFVGTGMILWSGRISGTLGWGHVFGLAAGILYGLALTLIRLSRFGANNSLTPYFYICLAGVLVCGWPLVFGREPVMVGAEGWAYLVLLSVLAALAHLSTNKALAYIPSPRVGVIGMSEVLMGAVVGYLLFQESIGPIQVTGAFLVLGCGLVITIRPHTG